MKLRTVLASTTAVVMMAGAALADDGGDAALLFTTTNGVSEGQNAVLGFERNAETGALTPLKFGPTFTGGTGMNNNTHGKVGPHDNDTPLAVSDDGKWLFTVNAHSNTIASMKIGKNGQLTHAPGSPYDSRGVMPNSISVAGDVLLVSNRNGDYHQVEAIMGARNASYVSFKIQPDGSLKFVSKVEVPGFQKPTQVLISQVDPTIAFGNDFQVDADFDGAGGRSFTAGPEPRVQGQLHSFKIDDKGFLTQVETETLPETDPGHLYKGSPGVATLPLGIWDHPTKRLLYVGFITRNELGVYRYDEAGDMTFVTTVPNSGQDICWVLVNDEGTRVYTVNNLPRDEMSDESATISVYDISGDKAENPEEIDRTHLPLPGEWFVNNRNFEQPGSTPFQMTISPDGKFLYVVSQRINQRPENVRPEGNYIHTFAIGTDGKLTHSATYDFLSEPVDINSRPQGLVAINR